MHAKQGSSVPHPQLGDLVVLAKGRRADSVRVHNGFKAIQAKVHLIGLVFNGRNGNALPARPKQCVSGGYLISGNQATSSEDQVVASQSQHTSTVTSVGGCNADTIQLHDMRDTALSSRGVGRLKVLQMVIATFVRDNGGLMEAWRC